MRKILTTALMLSCLAVFAQNTTTTKVVMKQMTGAEAMRMLPKVTDPKIYDREGNVIDSAEARAKVKSFDYKMGMSIPAGQTEYKHVLSKVDHVQQDQMDASVRMMFRPANPKLWDGVTLDLSPLAKHMDVSKLDGKAIVLLFYMGANGYKDMYDGINDAVANSIDSHKFEVIAITHLDYIAAKNTLKSVPILNAHHIVDAADVTDFYETGHHAMIVVTNAQHQITYAAKDGPAMAPRTLNKLLKAL